MDQREENPRLKVQNLCGGAWLVQQEGQCGWNGVNEEVVEDIW